MKLPDTPPTDPDDAAARLRQRLLQLVGASVFLLFFQTFMVAPLIPTLATAFHASRQAVSLIVPAYTLPYAAMALVCGVLADRFGRRGILFTSLVAFPLLGLAMACAPGLSGLIALRALSGVTNVGIVVMGLALVGDWFRPAERGQAIGWVFGAIAGGCSFGSTLGGVLSPLIGWRGLFVLLALAGVLQLLAALPLWRQLRQKSKSPETGTAFSARQALAGYLLLLRSPRGARTYAYIVLNGIFHSGVFTWLGVLLHDRYRLSDAGIGLALLGYGVPGLLLGPAIGRLVDQHGRRRLIPAGLLTAAIAGALLAPSALPLWVAIVAVTVLSLGFDMTHPLFAGIVTTLSDRNRGQAMGLNTFSLFLGMGFGSLAFGWLGHFGLSAALTVFAVVQGLIGLLAFSLFEKE